MSDSNRSPRLWLAASTSVTTSASNNNIREEHMPLSIRLPPLVAAPLIAGPLFVMSTFSAAFAQDAWTTPLATKLGVALEKTFDSSGPDAWDPKKHPLVFVST